MRGQPAVAMLGAAIACALLAGCAAERVTEPNVLLVIADDLNTDLGAYGAATARTPNIDRIARQGVTFTRAYAQYPQCNQSRASLLTGLYPDQVGVLDLETPLREHRPDLVTLPQHFRQAGYFTARVGKVFHQGVPPDIGTDGLDDPVSWDRVINPRGIDTEVDEQIHSIVPPEKDRRRFGGTLSWLSLAGEDREHTDGIGADEAIRVMKEHHPARTGQPFFLALGFYRPHTPFVAPDHYFDLHPAREITLPVVPDNDRDGKPVAALADRPYQAEMSEATRREVIQAYRASVSFMDVQLGRVLESLESQGLADNTIVVFMSDHGYHLGDHGLWQKADLFERALHTPLVLSGPGVPVSESREQVVELVDLFPTLLSLAGLAPPDVPGVPLPGCDLLPAESADEPRCLDRAALSQAWSSAWRTRRDFPKHEVMGYTLRTERFRYTVWNDGDAGEELYDYLDDPAERYNLADDPSWREVKTRLRNQLEKRRQQAR